MSFVFGSNSASTGYNLTRSLRFRASASATLVKTFASGGNQKTWTLSFWVKRGTLGTAQAIFDTGVFTSSDSTLAILGFTASDTINFSAYSFSYRTTTQVFRDPSAWYHIVLNLDTTQATAANRVKLYVNGTQVTAFSSSTDPTLNTNYAVNQSAYSHTFGYPSYSYGYFDGYLAEVNFIDGQALTPSSFGSTNVLTGVWQPAAYTGSYGTTGFVLDFEDNSALTTSSNAGLGKDTSGNGNYFPTTNISITAGVTYDSMTDVPTLTSATAANFAVLNPLDVSGTYLSRANQRITTGAAQGGVRSTMAFPTTAKIYFEVINASATSDPSTIQCGIGIANRSANLAGGLNGVTGIWGVLWAASRRYLSANGSSSAVIVGELAINSTMQVAVDLANGYAWVGVNDTWYNASNGTTGNPSTGANATFTGLSGDLFGFADVYSMAADANFGQRPFSYTPPTGFVALNTYNLPTSTIVKGNTVMDATTYSGVTGGATVTNAGAFKPDLVWMKSRSVARNHELVDSVRGIAYTLFSNQTNAEATDTRISSFNSNGFTYTANSNSANTGDTDVAWQWQAGQGTNTSNTNGTITSTVSVNASAGFSVATFTRTAAATDTAGHGLGVKPAMVIIKARSTTSNWNVWHQALDANPDNFYILLDSTAGKASSGSWCVPTSSVVGVTNFSNGTTAVMYSWAQIAGFSAFGSYTGNGSTDGPFIYLGFRPRWVMFKDTVSASQWRIWDTARDPYNITTNALYANSSGTEQSADNYLDIVSNGFKIRSTNAGVNTNAGNYIYMAFAENPFRNALAR